MPQFNIAQAKAQRSELTRGALAGERIVIAGDNQALVNLRPIRLPHLTVLESLPRQHRDPFDRRLIAQAGAEHLTIVTHDAAFRQYAVASIW